ncbi:MAG: PIN domain-containing protein [Actinomycetota bacterium]|nr:PIN domain-containing protein [Actinomycetota bacterium]
MGLLDVNVLVALAWDAHVHHEAAGAWFDRQNGPWATCPISEVGFVRVSSNPTVLAGAISVDRARSVLRGLRAVGEHRFLANDVSPTDADFPALLGHRQVTDALLLAVARRAGLALVTFDTQLAKLAGGDGVELLAC